MKAFAAACLVASSQADFLDDAVTFYNKYQSGFARAILKSGANNLTDEDIENSTCMEATTASATCFTELADEDRTLDKFNQCQIKLSSIKSKCHIKELNTSVGKRFGKENRAALFGTAADFVVEGGLAAVYAIMDDEEGQANSKIYNCGQDLFDTSIGTEDTVEACMSVVTDLFQSASSLFDTTLGVF